MTLSRSDRAQLIAQYAAGPARLKAALAVVEAVRTNTLALIGRLPETAWTREGRHTESGRYTAEDWLKIYADHLEGHARQIEKNVELWQAARRR